MKIGIDCPYNRISSGKHSHRASWALIRASQLRSEGHEVKVLTAEDNWEDFDQIALYMGMEWQNSVQFPGGMQPKDLELIVRMLKPKTLNQMFRLDDVQLDGLVTSLNKRKDFHLISDEVFLKDLNNEIYNIHRKPSFSSTFDNNCLGEKVMVIGDSHANSVYTKGAIVHRNDFQTLNGALEKGLDSFLDVESITGAMGSLVFYFGNIDIRHHLCRLFKPDDRKKAVHDLVSSYCAQVKAMRDFHGCPITVVAPLYIENEDRKIPQTGYYKGKPFYGSQAERHQVRQWFLEALVADLGSANVFDWPHSWISGKAEMTEDVMERPRSVHLSPSFYPWDLFSDAPNEWWTSMGCRQTEMLKLKKVGAPLC